MSIGLWQRRLTPRFQSEPDGKNARATGCERRFSSLRDEYGLSPTKPEGRGKEASHGLGEQIVTTKTLRRRVALAGRLTRSARRLTLHLPQRWPWDTQAPWPGCEPFHSQPDGARPPLTRQPTQRPRKLAPSPRAPLAVSYPPCQSRHRRPQKRLRPPPTSRLEFEPGSSRL